MTAPVAEETGSRWADRIDRQHIPPVLMGALVCYSTMPHDNAFPVRVIFALLGGVFVAGFAVLAMFFATRFILWAGGGQPGGPGDPLTVDPKHPVVLGGALLALTTLWLNMHGAVVRDRDLTRCMRNRQEQGAVSGTTPVDMFLACRKDVSSDTSPDD